MFKSISCAAMAALSLCAFAQSNGQLQTNDKGESMSKNGIYYCDADLLASPPSTEKNTADYESVHWNVRHQAQWLNGADRFQLDSILVKAPGNVANSLCQALYNAQAEANEARYALVAQQVAANDQMAMTAAPGYTYFFAQTPSTMSAQATIKTYSDSDNRPMRMVLQQKREPNINYDDALDILDHELSQSAASSLNDWYLNQASDADRDVIVRMLKKDAWFKNQPIYASTLTHRNF